MGRRKKIHARLKLERAKAKVRRDKAKLKRLKKLAASHAHFHVANQ